MNFMTPNSLNKKNYLGKIHQSRETGAANNQLWKTCILSIIILFEGWLAKKKVHSFK